MAGVLSFQVDATQVDKGTASLNKLTDAADSAQASATKLNVSTVDASGGMKDAAGAADVLAAKHGHAGEAAEGHGRSIAKLSNQLRSLAYDITEGSVGGALDTLGEIFLHLIGHTSGLIAVMGVLGGATAIAFVVDGLLELNTSMSAIDIASRKFTDTSGNLSSELKELAEDFSKVGSVSAGTARQFVSTFASAGALPDQIRAALPLVKDYAAAMGETWPDAAKEMAKASTDAAGAAEDLGKQGILTVAQIQKVRDAASGGISAQYTEWLKQVGEATKGANAQLSAQAQAINNLKEGWHDFQEKIVEPLAAAFNRLDAINKQQGATLRAWIADLNDAQDAILAFTGAGPRTNQAGQTIPLPPASQTPPAGEGAAGADAAGGAGAAASNAAKFAQNAAAEAIGLNAVNKALEEARGQYAFYASAAGVAAVGTEKAGLAAQDAAQRMQKLSLELGGLAAQTAIEAASSAKLAGTEPDARYKVAAALQAELEVREGLLPASMKNIEAANLEAKALNDMRQAVGAQAYDTERQIAAQDSLADAYRVGTGAIATETAASQAEADQNARITGTVAFRKQQLLELAAASGVATQAQKLYNEAQALQTQGGVADAAAVGGSVAADRQQQQNQRDLDYRNTIAKLDAARTNADAAHLADLDKQADAAARDLDSRNKIAKLDQDAANNKYIADQTFQISQQIDLERTRAEIVGDSIADQNRIVAIEQARLALVAQGVTAEGMRSDAVKQYLENVGKLADAASLTADAQRSADLWTQPFKDAVSSVQSDFTDMFDNVFAHGKSGFSGLADSLKNTFTHLISQLASMGLMSAIVGGLGLGGSSAASGIPSLSGGSAIFGGITGSLNSAGSAIGLAGGTGSTGASGGDASTIAGGGILGSATGSSIASGLVGGIALGSGVGGAVGGHQENAAIGSAVGAIAGLVIGSYIPVIGTALGGAIGGVIGGIGGGLFGPGPKNYPAGTFVDLQSGTLGSNYYGNGPQNVGAVQQLAQQVATIAQTISKDTGGSITGTGQVYVDPNPSIYRYTDTNGGGATASSSQALIDQVIKYFATSIVGVSDDVKKVISQSTASTIDANLAFLKTYTSLIAAPSEALTDLGQTVKNLGDTFDAAKLQASGLGLNVDTLSAAYTANIAFLKGQFDDATKQSILEITNPLQAALDANDKAMAQAEADAALVGGNINDIETLYGLKRQQIVEGTNQALTYSISTTMDNIQKLLDSLTIGSASALSPGDQYAGARGAFMAGEATINANPNAVPTGLDLNSLASNFLNTSRALYASGPQYAADYATVTDFLKQLLGQQAAGVDPNQQAVVELQSANLTLSGLLQEIQGLRADQNIQNQRIAQLLASQASPGTRAA